MKVLKRILLGLVVVLVLLVVVGFLLPSAAHVERSTVIAAPAAVIFPLLDNPRELNRWSPWVERFPDVEYTYTGPEAGVGARMAWASSEPGGEAGFQEITASDPPRRVETRLGFGPQGKESHARAYFQLDPEGDGTRVTWGMDSDFGYNLVYRYLGLTFDRWVGSDYEQGLAKLKPLAESLPAPSPVAIEEVELEARDLAFVSGITTIDEAAIGAALGTAYGQVQAFLRSAGLEPTGPPVAVTTEWNEEQGRWAFEAGLRFEGRPATAVPPVQVGKTHGGRAVRAVHVGPYRNLPATYEALDAYLNQHGLTAAGRPWEEYVSDPATTPEAELITHVYYPLQ